jgi:hypothetical protein
MSSFCQSLTEKHIHPRSQIEGIELSKDMICTKTFCTPAQCKNPLPAIQENFGFAGVQESYIVFTKSASQKQGYPAVEGRKQEKESLSAVEKNAYHASLRRCGTVLQKCQSRVTVELELMRGHQSQQAASQGPS